MLPYRLLGLFFSLFLVAEVRAEDHNYVEIDLSSPRAAIITYLGSLQTANCHRNVAAKVFSQKERTEEEAIELAVRLKNILDEKGIQIDLDKVSDNSNYIDPKYKFHRYQIAQALPKIYLVKVQGQWLYSEPTVQYIQAFYEQHDFLAKKGLLKWLPPFFKKKVIFKLYVWQLIATFLTLLFVVSIHQLVSSLYRQLLRLFATRGGYEEVKALAEPLSLLFLTFLTRTMLVYLNLPLPVYNGLIKYTKSFAAFIAMVLCYYLVDVGAFYIHKKTLDKKVDFNLILLPMARVSLKVLVLVVGVLITLKSLNFNIQGILAGFGIGGLGFALASQDTIKNFFGSLVILTDKPFDVGDMIVSGDIDGKVEEIGFRSTRIHTSKESTIYVPNAKLADSYINNFGLKQYKEFNTIIAIAYNTPLVLIETFIEGLRKIAERHPSTREGKQAIYLNDLKESRLEIKFEVKFNVTDGGKEKQVRHELLLGIIKLAEELGIPLSFPTQTLHMESFPEKKPNTPTYITDPESLKERLNSFLTNQQPVQQPVE
jgi:MscS family membrane protein